RRKRRGAAPEQSIPVKKQTVQHLEKLRQQSGKSSVAEVLEEALEVYARLRTLKDRAAYERLTPRLRQALGLIAQGRSNKEIAHQLKISAKTVEFDRARLLRRLGVDGSAGLVRYAIRVGVILP